MSRSAMHASVLNKTIGEEQGKRQKLLNWIETLKRARQEHIAVCSDHDFPRYREFMAMLKSGVGHNGGIRYNPHPQTTTDLSEWDGVGYEQKELELEMIEERLTQLRKQLPSEEEMIAAREEGREIVQDLERTDGICAERWQAAVDGIIHAVSLAMELVKARDSQNDLIARAHALDWDYAVTVRSHGWDADREEKGKVAHMVKMLQTIVDSGQMANKNLLAILEDMQDSYGYDPVAQAIRNAKQPPQPDYGRQPTA